MRILIALILIPSVAFARYWQSYPYSTVIHSGSTSIPSDAIARVDAIADNGTVTLNSSVVIDTTNQTQNVAVDIIGTGPNEYAVPAGYHFEGHVCNFGASAGVIRINRTSSSSAMSVATGSCSIQAFNMGEGGYIRTSAADFLSVVGVIRKNAPPSRYASFNAMPGDVISGTGTWRAVVTLFRR